MTIRTFFLLGLASLSLSACWWESSYVMKPRDGERYDGHNYVEMNFRECEGPQRLGTWFIEFVPVDNERGYYKMNQKWAQAWAAARDNLPYGPHDNTKRIFVRKLNSDSDLYSWGFLDYGVDGTTIAIFKRSADNRFTIHTNENGFPEQHKPESAQDLDALVLADFQSDRFENFASNVCVSLETWNARGFDSSIEYKIKDGSYFMAGE